MSRALSSAIATQDAAGVVAVRCDEDQATARRRRAVSFARPIGLRVLAWCDRHPDLVARHRPHVDALREAMRAGGRIAALLVDLYSDVPEAMEAEA